MGVMTETTPEQPSETTVAAVAGGRALVQISSARWAALPDRGVTRHARGHCVHHRGDLLERFHSRRLRRR